MKDPIFRLFSLLLALLLCIGTLSGVVTPASAEETQDTGETSMQAEVTDSYVLSYDSAVEGYAYGHLPYMYTSPFRMSHSYNDPGAGPDSVWSYSYSNEIFQLINMSKLAEGGEGPYASIAVYCTDADTSTRSTSTYRRINLEDSTYHASGAAARLRSVVLSSFPYVQDMDVITAAANSWLEQNEKTPVQELKIGEVMVATQQAIWKITHGEKYTVDDHYSYFGGYEGDEAVYQINKDEVASDYTEQNITSLYHYFLALPGTAPASDAVSEFTFENVAYNNTRAEDGTYAVSVSFTVNTMVGEGDSLTLSATCADQVQSIPLTEPGDYSFTFEGLSTCQEVTVEINGYQTGADVYLFDALGDRTSSQSMVGYDDSRLPVHGEITATPNRVVTIYKTTNDEGKMPLANIEFDIYQIATMEQVVTGEVKVGEKPTAEEAKAYQSGKPLVTTLKTDVLGMATYDFTANGYPDGVYMVVEKFSAATTGPVDPFFLVIPATTEDEKGHVYSITVSPKNTKEVGPDIKKDVTKIENNTDTFDVEQAHTWIVRGGVPAGIGSAEKYMITDTIDYRLTYTKGSPVVKLFTKAGEELPMTLSTHYTLSEGTQTVDGYSVDNFTISLTKEGMAFVAQNLGAGSEIPEIRVYFQAVINTNASMGEEIPNKAHLDYVNSAGVEYDADSDEPEVHTGGANLIKTDVEGKPLDGATFKIAREATAEEMADTAVVKEKLTFAEKTMNVVFVDFHGTTDMSEEPVSEITTGEDGKAAFYGLAYGTYYILETKAPNGYNLLTSPIRVNINQFSHLTKADEVMDDDEKPIDNTIRVINTKFVLPETGGMGTTMFTATGLAIIGAAAMLILLNAKKRRV